MQDFRNRLPAVRRTDDLTYRSVANVPYFMRVVKQEILKDPLAFFRFHLIKSVPFFITDGIRDIARFLEYIGPPTTNLTDLFLKGNFSEMAKFIFKGNLEFNLFIIGFTFWLAVTFFMVVGALGWALSPKADKAYGLFIFLMIIYFFVASGPIANGRFRMPVIPWMMAFALYGLGLTTGWFKKIDFFSLDLET